MTRYLYTLRQKCRFSRCRCSNSLYCYLAPYLLTTLSRKEAITPQIQKDRSGKMKGICGRASGCIPKRDSRRIWVQRNRSLSGYEASENHPQKKATRYREQDEKKAAAYQEEISAYPILKIAYVDECGMDTYLYRQYGYAARG